MADVPIEQVHIPVDAIERNPRNPRPLFHLKDDDPSIVDLGQSLKASGQTQPAMVFLLQGHWCEPDRPGVYMLLQGERRWRASKVAELSTLRCQVVETPQSHANELFLLGAEGSYKQDWQPYYVMKWARDLAKQMSLAIDAPDIRKLTGLNRIQLVEASKMFSLETPIIERVERYEEERYRQRLGTIKKGRLKVNELGIQEFTVGRAASVWDLFSGLRQNFSEWDMVSERSDLELQELLADQATGRRSKHGLENLVSLVRQNKAGSCDPQLKIELERILTRRATIGEAGASFGFADLEKYSGLERTIERLNTVLVDAARRKFVIEGQLSEADINRGLRKVSILSRTLDGFIQQLERRAKMLEKIREES